MMNWQNLTRRFVEQSMYLLTETCCKTCGCKISLILMVICFFSIQKNIQNLGLLGLLSRFAHSQGEVGVSIHGHLARNPYKAGKPTGRVHPVAVPHPVNLRLVGEKGFSDHSWYLALAVLGSHPIHLSFPPYKTKTQIKNMHMCV